MCHWVRSGKAFDKGNKPEDLPEVLFFHQASGRKSCFRPSYGRLLLFTMSTMRATPLPFILSFSMKVKFPFFQALLIIFTLLSWVACGDQKDCCVPPPPDNEPYTQGIFVVNEGPFGGTGTISWYSLLTGEVRDSIYEKANNGASLGLFVQSVAFHKDKAYIVVNGANRVVVVKASTFEYLDTIGPLQQPRYFLPVDDNTAYISQWGADGLTGSVAKVNLNTLDIEKTIPTGSGPEKMVLFQDALYVPNSGGYGVDSTITQITLTDDSAQILDFAIGKNPASIQFVENGANDKLFFLCKGYFLDPTPQGWLNYLPETISGYPTPAYADDLTIDPATGHLYFIGNNQVYKASPNGADVTISPLFTGSIYAMTLDPETGLFYCADAKDFSSNGEIFARRPDGSVQFQFRAGVAPGDIVIVK